MVVYKASIVDIRECSFLILQDLGNTANTHFMEEVDIPFHLSADECLHIKTHVNLF